MPHRYSQLETTIRIFLSFPRQNLQANKRRPIHEMVSNGRLWVCDTSPVSVGALFSGITFVFQAKAPALEVGFTISTMHLSFLSLSYFSFPILRLVSLVKRSPLLDKTRFLLPAISFFVHTQLVFFFFAFSHPFFLLFSFYQFLSLVLISPTLILHNLYLRWPGYCLISLFQIHFLLR